MGIQTMGSQSNGQQSHLQANQLVKQNSWYGLTLDEVNNLLGDLGKPLGSMNLDELLQNVWTAEGNKVVGIESEHVPSSSSSLQRQASMTLARALSGKTVDDVWREIQHGQKKQYGDAEKIVDGEMTLGDTTLEDFLVQAGLFAGGSVSSTVELDAMDIVIPQSFQPKTGLLSSSSVSSMSDTKPGRRRDTSDAYEKALERRLKRKIKNRESAARSRARKQAYHNELAEMSRKLRFLMDQINKAGIMSPSPVLQSDTYLEDIEVHLAEHEHEIIEMNSNSEKLQQSYNELLEFKSVLQKACSFLVSNHGHAVSEERELEENVYSNGDFIETPFLFEQEMMPDPSKSNQSGLRFISGIICKSKLLRFERMLFRATRGNMLFNQAPADEQIMDPISTEMVEKTVFVVFFSGEQARMKILKICEAFGANCYPVPEDISKQRQITQEVSSRLADLEATLDAGIRHRNKALSSVGGHLAKWMDMVRREKAVYDTLNMLNFDVTKKCLVAEGWCPIFARTQIQEALQRATFDSNSQVGVIFHSMDALESPPTYFRTNSFTNPYQEIVDAYGVARYQEANPAVYTTIIFPFLFAVMFGDWGHGICLLLGALVLIAHESKLGNQRLGSFMEMLYGGRYVLLLMSLFSMYCGLIYNEFFSVPFHIFGASAYKCQDISCRDAHTTGLVKYREPYPFGVDPSWRGSRSELPFLNSLKMKMSILFGVVHMNLGIMLSYFNARFFGSSLDIRYQFVPQMIFLNSLFGYLSLLIVVKWCSGSQADLYHIMIYMFLSPLDNLGENELFRGQRPLQVLLLILALIAVPWMLFPKPFILKKLHNERFQGRNYGVLNTSEVDLEAEPDSARQHREEFNFSEVFVHQMIHSIEFVLGSVSNTASYLRLWALSLAHSELSTVFYEKVLLLAWGYDNLIIRLVGLVVFAFATAFILLMMETLSAFLHALRLHWVEFQNKFYHGDGYKFKPFSFAALTEDDN